MIHVAAAVVFQLALLVSGIETTVTINPVVIVGDGDGGDVCLSMEKIQYGLQTIRESVKAVVVMLDNVSNHEHCGEGLWSLVAYLNMNDPSQQCPSAWREYNTNGIRACGRPVSSVGSCPSTTYPTNHQYSKVCGRVIGYQVASPDAFRPRHDINGFYMDGVSITHGSPRNHIWSYVSGLFEFDTLHARYTCFCTHPPGLQPASFVGDNYFCESGNPTNTWEYSQIFTDDKLWDNKQCGNEGTCCTTKSPPWFSVEQSNPTIDDIEIRICGDESTNNEDTPIVLLEVYVQ